MAARPQPHSTNSVSAREVAAELNGTTADHVTVTISIAAYVPRPCQFERRCVLQVLHQVDVGGLIEKLPRRWRRGLLGHDALSQSPRFFAVMLTFNRQA